MFVDIASICDAATSDSSGKLNILGAFDTIYSQKFPTNHPQSTIAFRVRGALKDLKKDKFKIEMKKPDQKVLFSYDFAINFGETPDKKDDEEVSINLVYNISNLPLETAGTYQISLLHEQKVLKEIPFKVIHAIPVNK